MKEFDLYLIRHGQTYCNENHLYCGFSDISLSEQGILELKEKIEKTKYPKTNYKFTSGMKRTNETFNLIYGMDEYGVIEEFKEFNFGDFELKSYEQLKKDKNYIKWITDKTLKVKCPNGESKEEFYERIKKGLQKLIDKDIDKGVVVCHGGTIGTLLEIFCKEKDFCSYQPKCGGGYKLKIKYDGQVKIEILEEI